MIWETGEVALLALAIGALLLAIEAGYRLGLRCKADNDEASTSHLNLLQSALLGLLALLLGFTFSMSISRLETRKLLVLEEANAIGTTYLRSHFLAEPLRGEVADLLRQYVAARLEHHRAGIDPVLLKAARDKGAEIENRLWRAAIAAAASAPDSLPVSLFVESLNETIDVNEKRQVAFENHVPEVVIVLLFVVSAVAVGFLGYANGLTGKRRVYSTAIFAVLIALVLAVILDTDRPRRGLVQVSQSSLLRLEASMAQPVASPAAADRAVRP